MRAFERLIQIVPERWLEYEPPSLCHDPLTDAIAAIGATAAAAGSGTAAATGATALAAGDSLGLGTAAAGSGILSSLPSLSTIGTAASLGGTLLSATAASQNASYNEKLATAASTAANAKSNQDVAAGERQQITQQRQTDLVLSRARALAGAAGGGGVTDTTNRNLLGQIAQQGDYNALSALYNGQAAASAQSYQGAIDLFKGQQAKAALPAIEAGTILSGLGTATDRWARLRLSPNSPASSML